MPEKLCLSIKVRNYHIDSYGHVNNAQYLNYLEDARTDFFDELGFSLPSLRARGLQIFITNVNLRYRQPAKLGDTLLVYGWLGELASRRATWQHQVLNQQTSELVLTASVSGMFLNDGRLASIPQDIRAVMQRIYFPACKITS